MTHSSGHSDGHLAIFGIVVVGFFFFTMTAVRDLNFNNMLTLQFGGATDVNLFQTPTAGQATDGDVLEP